MPTAMRIPGPIGITPANNCIDAGTLALVAMPAPAAKPKPADPPPDADTLQLAATAYGEAGGADDANEIGGIVRVLLRQAKARGHTSVAAFIAKDKTFAFAAHDGNARYKALIAASPAKRAANAGMKAALAASRDALAGIGTDPSNGGYFWDGADLKTNFKRHPKVLGGIHFTDPLHDIYGVGDKDVAGENWWLDAKGKKTTLRGSWSYKYESTAAHGGTVFWKYNADFIKATGNKVYD